MLEIAAREIDSRIRESVAYARTNPEANADFVRAHAREDGARCHPRHIDLYVNEYTLALDQGAVKSLLAFGVRAGFFALVDLPIFAY